MDGEGVIDVKDIRYSKETADGKAPKMLANGLESELSAFSVFTLVANSLYAREHLLVLQRDG